MIEAILRLWGSLPIPQWLRWRLVRLAVPKFVVGVVGVIFNSVGEVLLFRHTYRGSRCPWGLPSGWLDPLEDPAQCIIREFREETGLEVRVIRPLLIENVQLIRHIDLIFLCEWIGGDFRPSHEVDAMQFFSKETLPEMIPRQREVIIQLMNINEESHAKV